MQSIRSLRFGKLGRIAQINIIGPLAEVSLECLGEICGEWSCCEGQVGGNGRRICGRNHMGRKSGRFGGWSYHLGGYNDRDGGWDGCGGGQTASHANQQNQAGGKNEWGKKGEVS